MSSIAEAKRRIRQCIENHKTQLDLNRLGLTDLEKEVPELKECVHLEELNLEFNEITDLIALIGLNNLKRLELENNPISDVTALVDLEKLTYLSLYSTLISDVTALASLNKLQYLNLGDNPISDVTALAGLTNLTNLNLVGLRSNTLPYLNLNYNLNLRYNPINDITALANLTNLTMLELQSNQISDVTALADLKKLEFLILGDNPISDVTALADLTNLRTLVLKSSPISDITALANLTNLTILGLQSNSISDVTALANLTNLTMLELQSNQISDVTALAGLKKLTYLDLGNNQISDFSPLLKNVLFQNESLRVKASQNPKPFLNAAVEQGYGSLKAYYDTLNAEGKIQNDQLKVILLGNSTAGKTSLLRYWGRKDFSERQTTTHGIATWIDIPLQGNTPEQTFRVNAWDFGGQDYYHATHRLFITPDSTYVLVCNQDLENRRGEELTTEFMLINGEETPVQVPVQHYPYRFWLETLAFLTKTGSIETTTTQDRSRLPKLFLVENKCGTYQHNQQMRLDEKLTKTLPFEVIGGDFYHLDIREAWRFSSGQDASDEANEFHLAYKKFEKQLLQTLRAQIESNRYEVHANFPKIRDILARMADDLQSTTVQSGLAQLLNGSKIAPIESYEKLPVWISYAQYQDIVQRNSKSNFEDIEGFLHTYLQNLCGCIFHFKDIPALADIVFIDPNWLHQSIYKVLSQEVLDQQGFFTLEEADRVIDGNILEAATFMEVMKAFELVFEVPQQSPRQFVAPQYLPMQCPLSAPRLKKEKETNHKLALTLQFEHYLPPSLISRIISLKGHLIKGQNEPFWRNGLIYTEIGLSTLVLCTPESRTIEVFLGHANDSVKQQALREFMAFMEEKFSNELGEVLLSLPSVSGVIKWKHLYRAKKEGGNRAKNYAHQAERELVEVAPFLFLVQDFAKKPVNVFVCYSHEDQAEMKAFTSALAKEFKSFEKQHGININPFNDLELRTGDLWHEVLQENIKKNDLLICLLSPTFFTSEYIQEHEYGKKMKEIATGNTKAVIAPIFIKPCHVAVSNPIANLQFFKPESERFGLGKIENFAFSNLLNKDQTLIHNYVSAFVTDIETKILKIWEEE